MLKCDEHNRIDDKLDEVLLKLDSLQSQNIVIKEAMESLMHVEVKNGGGRTISFRRNEFFQMLYDRPKELLDNVTNNSKKISTILEAVFKVGTIVAVLVALFK